MCSWKVFQALQICKSCNKIKWKHGAWCGRGHNQTEIYVVGWEQSQFGLLQILGKVEDWKMTTFGRYCQLMTFDFESFHYSKMKFIWKLVETMVVVVLKWAFKWLMLIIPTIRIILLSLAFLRQKTIMPISNLLWNTLKFK